MMVRFAHPVVLALLVLVLGWLRYALKRKPRSLTYSMTSKMAELAGSDRRLWQKAPLILRTSCLLLLVLAAARPQLFHLSGEMRSPGVDIILCLDTSGSMEALDFRLEAKPVTRLTAVKKVVRDFINKREMDRVGLVVFGDQAFTLSPLTMDKGLLMELVDKMETGMAGPCTAIGSALAIGGMRLKDLTAKSKILVLLTDGRHNAGGITPEQAAAANHSLGIKIYTIGVAFNPVLDICKHIIFREKTVFKIERHAKFGGTVEFQSFRELESAYAQGKLHPQDLKNGVAAELAEILEPVRRYFETNSEARKCLETVRQFKVTR